MQSSLGVIASVCEAASGGVAGSAQEGKLGATHTTATPDHLRKRTSLESEFPLPPLNQAATREEDGVPAATKPQDGSLTANASSVMESFEASAALQEAEDRLEQLFLEDELSDARIGMAGSSDFEMGIGLLTAEPTSPFSAANRTTTLGAHKPPNDRRNEGAPPRARLEQLGRRGSQVATVSSSSAFAVPPELANTLDAKEKERLEDSMAIAGYTEQLLLVHSTLWLYQEHSLIPPATKSWGERPGNEATKTT